MKKLELKSFQRKKPLRRIRQGVSYSDDFSLAVTTKFCTSNSSSKILKLNTKKILTLQAFQPCITLWVLN